MKLNVKPEIIALKDKLFKATAYDIRAYVGEVGDFFSSKAVLTPDAMKVAGVLMGSLTFKCADGTTVALKDGDAVVVGYDNGPTSEALAAAFSEGLTSQGINVYNIGIASSGQVYHNQNQLNAQGHVQITRSHVEVTTNGAKFGIGTQGIHTYLLKQMNEAVLPTIGRDSKTGTIIDKVVEGRKLYYEKMIKRYGDYFKIKPRKVAVNLFGGTGMQYKDLFKEILGDVIILGDTLNVNDGKILADPTRKEMLEKVPDLQNVLSQGLRVHSFDLDADRGSITEGEGALCVGERGHYLGDDLSYILADYKLSVAVPELFKALSVQNIAKENLDKIHKTATTVIVDPRYTSGVAAFVKAKGGDTMYHRKGHSLWKETMTANMKEMAKLAGCSTVEEFMAMSNNYKDIQIEASLHLFSTDPEDAIPRDDAVENVFLMEMVLDSLNIKSLHNYFSKITHRYATKEIRTNCISNEAKDKITEEILNFIRDKFSSDKFTIIEFDGQIRVDWATGFVMYGMSNTSPKLTMMVEGTTVEERNAALAFILAVHNTIRAKHGDTLSMDISENPFFIKDSTYSMTEPDSIDFNDFRVKNFVKNIGVEI